MQIIVHTYIYICAATDLHRGLRKGQATVAASWPWFPAGSLRKRLLVWKELRSDPQEMEVCKVVLYESGKSRFYTISISSFGLQMRLYEFYVGKSVGLCLGIPW